MAEEGSLTDEDLLASLRIEPAPSGYCAAGFDCGETEMNAYICDGTSASDQLAGVSRSYLVFREDELVGYFTVLADSIRLKPKERPDGSRYSTAPAVKLGRLGVSNTCRRRGVGTWILDNVVGLARSMALQVGVRYVTLDALAQERLVSWYADYGFVTNKAERDAWKTQMKSRGKPDEEPRTVSMRYDILLEEETGLPEER